LGALSWLPSAPREAHAPEAPWVPPELGRSPKGVRYLFVDEIVGSVVGLALCQWPSVDAQGRLRFGGRTQMLGAGRAELQQFLAMHRRPTQTTTRPIRIGDVFAVEVIADALAEVSDQLQEQRRLEPLLSPSAWIKPPVHDLTSAAREAAKVSFYAAVTPTLKPSEAKLVAELTDPEG
jgi:hypothetical protein